MSPQLEAFIEYIQIIKGLSPKTVEAYRSDLLSLETTLGKPMIEMQHDDVFKAVSEISNRRTLNRKLSSANAFFQFCFKQELISCVYTLTYIYLLKY